LAPKTYFRIGRLKNKVKHRFYFDLRILWAIQIHFVGTGIRKIQKLGAIVNVQAFRTSSCPAPRAVEVAESYSPQLASVY
jgi:hypothetical protein